MIDYRQLTPRGQLRRMRRLAQHALTLYGVEPVSLSVLTRDYNTTFAVRELNGARYMLRIHRIDDDSVPETRRRARIESELWWLDRLRTDLDLPVPAVVRTSGDEGVVRVDGEGVEPRLCVLFHWMEGRFLRRRLQPAHLEQVGRLTASLHEHSAQLTVPAFFDRPRVDEAAGETEERVVRVITERWSADAAGMTRAVLQRVRQAQEELGGGPDTYGLIHADIHQTNYLFSDGQVRLIDFDDCGWGHYLYDLAVTVHLVASLPQAPALRGALLAGYRQVRDLSPGHEALIDTLGMLRELQDVTWILQEQDSPSFGDPAAHVGDGVAKLERFLAGGGSR